jgi:transmembrane sensor
LIDRFPDDPHAPVAAFTIGRLLLESLGQPRQAAASFERARVLANGAPLAEDALAREVEAWASAGEPALAHRRAELYRQLYPNGARRGAVMRVGGLDKSAP